MFREIQNLHKSNHLKDDEENELNTSTVSDTLVQTDLIETHPSHGFIDKSHTYQFFIGDKLTKQTGNNANVHLNHLYKPITNDDDLNNSFSYHCPYGHSEHNSLESYGFNQLNSYYCPHQQGNYERKADNKKNYTKRQKERIDLPKNNIHLDNVLKLKDKRTTIMIRHIPNKYTLSILLQELNVNFQNKFDILYLPIDYIHNTNLGFGFINFIDPMHLLYFYDSISNQKWKFFNSGKRCQLVYSKFQGKQEFMEYIKKKNCSSGLNMAQETFVNLNTTFINNSPGSPIEIPMKYYNVFVNYYPYSLCSKVNDNVFVVRKYYNF